MENASQVSESAGGDDLLVARQKITAARSRASIPSDTTAGKSDGND